MKALSAQIDYDKQSETIKLRIQQEFDYFCKTVIKNEFLNSCKEATQQRRYESSLHELESQEQRQLYTIDRYFKSKHILLLICPVFC